MAHHRQSLRGLSRLECRALSVACILAIGMAAPAGADLRANQILGIGIEMLNQSQRAQQERARRQQPSQQPQIRRDTRQPAPAARQPRAVRSELVAETQRRLNELGYDAGTVDGFSGPQTRRAIIRFQQDYGLAQTGEASARLVSTLRDQQALSGYAAQPAPAPMAGQAWGMQMLQGTDLPGGDYRSGLTDPRLEGTGVDGCAELCMQDDFCAGFTYNAGAEICILKDSVRRQESYPRAVSGIKNGGARPQGLAGAPAAMPPGAAASLAPAPRPAPPGAPPAKADLIHMALMSDIEAYRAEAEQIGTEYLIALGSSEQCRAVDAANRSDEFTRRDFRARAAEQFRQVLASLQDQPRRAEIPVEQSYSLGEYDFDRGGFELALQNSAQLQIVKPATVFLDNLYKQEPFCTMLGMSELFRLGVEHKGFAPAAFLPMSEADARAFRASGNRSITLKAVLIAEPRDQGRGPLKGRIANMAAYDPKSEQLLYRWENDLPAEDAAPSADQMAEWSAALVASLAAPVMEPIIDDSQLDTLVISYLGAYANQIRDGNPPPGSPLPIEALRGQSPAVVAARNRDRLREALRNAGPALPLTVEIRQDLPARYKEGEGLLINADNTPEQDLDLLQQIELSDRDLPMNDRFLPVQGRQRGNGFVASTMASMNHGIRMELDRIILSTNVPITLDEAGRRNLLGYSDQADRVVARWVMDITETRAARNDAIISAAVRSVSYHWASDDALIKEVSGAEFPTVAALRGQADTALGVLDPDDDIQTPADGSRWGAEMTDLLQLRLAPDSVSDSMIERMMISRFQYEAGIRDGAPEWGRFFREPGAHLSDEVRQARLTEFRDWTMARAQAMPARLTLQLPLNPNADGQRAIFENAGRSDYMNHCNRQMPAQQGQEEQAMVQSRICAYLEAAWNLPEPLLFLRDGLSLNQVTGLRYDCLDDGYCDAMHGAQSKLAMKWPAFFDVVQMDRLPVLDAAARQRSGEQMIELVVEVQSAAVQASYPASIWRNAVIRAHEFGRSYGYNPAGLPRDDAPEAPLLILQAKAVSARLIDRDSGAVLGELPLAEPALPSDDLLAMPDSMIAKVDVLGIRLGMSFDEADRLIREHMKVGKVLSADRNRQLSTASGALRAYGSGRIYASEAEDELIAIFDEPPSAPGKVLGLWRVLRLPKGSVDPLGLKATLAERYGEPNSIAETSLPFMAKGLTWVWRDASDRSCNEISFDFQQGLWQDENGQTDWLPAFLKRPYFPVLHASVRFDQISDDPASYAYFCRGVLGVRFASYDKDNGDQSIGDEIVTWLSDNRAYARQLYESRKAPAPAPAAPVSAGGAAIKF